MTKIKNVELYEFKFDVKNLANITGANSVGGIGYAKGGLLEIKKFAIKIITEDGTVGEYVTHWCSTDSTFSQASMLAPKLLGRNAEEREGIYDDFKRELRQFDHMGHGPLDIALWDWIGKKLNCSVNSLLGGFKKKLPAYASTYHGDRNGGLDSKEAFSDFAYRCYDLGYRAFKIHGWSDGNAKEEADNLLYVAKSVGDKMTLMLDPACELRTFADALYVGRACDEANYFWLEDPSLFHNEGLATTLFHNCNISKNANFLWEFLLHFINMLKIFQVYSSLLAQWLRQTPITLKKSNYST